MKHSASIQVPATSANLGAGFDALGVTVSLYNTVTLTKSTKEWSDPFLENTAGLFFRKSGVKAYFFNVSIEGDVPTSRGLGSSVTVRLGVLMALNQIYDNPLAEEEILNLCVELEGHPDNAVPAFYGGFVAASSNRHVRVAVDPELKFIAAIPDFRIQTDQARQVLPSHVSFGDAVTNIQNSSMVTAAFCSKNYEALQGCFFDCLHQPFRGPLFPGFEEAVLAAEHTGALGAYLSGSGSTIMALCLEKERDIASAMKLNLELAGHKNVRTHILTADNDGAKSL